MAESANTPRGTAHDPLHIPVPPELVERLKNETAADLDCAAGAELIAALGGAPCCFERFLVARELKLEAAAVMLRDTLRFRRDEVSKLLPISAELRSKVEPHWPVSFCGRTLDGKPLMFVRLGQVDPGALMSSVTEEEFRAYYIHWVDLALRHQKACGNAKQVEVYDLQGLSLSQLHMGGLRMFARTLKVGQDHYMEGLHRCIIINAPRIFSMAWSVVSVVLSERSRAKTVIMSTDGAEYLEGVVGDAARVQAMLAVDVHGADKEGLAWLPKAGGGKAAPGPPSPPAKASPALGPDVTTLPPSAIEVVLEDDDEPVAVPLA